MSLKINKIRFNFVRNFPNNVDFNFENTTSINTLSGMNGSGKTSVFKALLLCQKAFFIELLPPSERLQHSISAELSKYFNSLDAYIEATFEIANDEVGFQLAKVKLNCIEYSSEDVKWALIVSESDRDAIARYWNLDSPSEIIAYIDSNKGISEEDAHHSNVSVIGSDPIQAIIDTVLYPSRIFTNIYRSLLSDYLSERLVPSRPRRDLYYIPTKVLVQSIIPRIEISNFSGQHHKGHFTILGRSKAGERSKAFDIRNFSSGEKTILYIIAFINYIKNVGLLIIDEPENHFHEELLTRFVNTLREITDPQINYADLILKLAKVQKVKVEGTTKKQIEMRYGNGYLSQVFLLTHSKNLIYNTFNSGRNFYLDNGIKLLAKEEAEEVLRGMGLSSIYSKVLFVEGSSDETFLSTFLSRHNIKIRSVDGCSQVISTYKRLEKLQSDLRENKFGYLIDKDTRTDNDVETIRSANPVYFDKHFVVLERHEFENYLLDAQLWFDIFNELRVVLPSIPLKSKTQIEVDIRNEADATKQLVFKKAILAMNVQTISKFNSTLISKSLPLIDQGSYESYYTTQIAALDIPITLLDDYKNNYHICKETILDNWDLEWAKVCDGKTAFNELIKKYSSSGALAMNQKLVRDKIRRKVEDSSSYDASKVLKDLVAIFEG